MPKPKATQQAKPVSYITERVMSAALPAGSIQPGLIKGMKVLGKESLNGRTYTESAIVGAVAKYEGARVNINHSRTPTDRSYGDHVGILENVQRAPDGGLMGDLRYNPSHPAASQIAWDAANAPHLGGLSHVIEATTSEGADGRTIVEAIENVISVDLVGSPATTKSFFESLTKTPGGRKMALTPEDWAAITADELKANRPDLFPAEPTPEADAGATAESVKRALAHEKLVQESATLKAELAKLKLEAAKAATAARVDAAIAEAKLPPHLVNDLLKKLLTESDAETGKLILAERVELAKQASYQNTTSTAAGTGPTLTLESFNGRLQGVK